MVIIKPSPTVNNSFNHYNRNKMKSIWKYPLGVTDIQDVPMPIGAEVLSVQIQHGMPCIWAIVDTAGKTEHRVFKMYGTGHPLTINEKDNEVFIGTFQVNAGALVFHLFEVKPKV